MQASTKAKVLNVSVLLSTLLALVSCLVVFVSALFTATVKLRHGEQATWSFYTLYVQTEAERIEYSGTLCTEEALPFCAPCTTGGQVLLAFTILEFVALLPLLLVTAFRIAGGTAISALAHPAHSVRWESRITVVAAVAALVGVATFWGRCVSHGGFDQDGFSVHITDLGFVLVSFLLLLVQLLVLAVFIQRDASTHLGWQASGLMASPLGRAFVDGREEEEYRQAQEIDQVRAAKRESLAQQHAYAAPALSDADAHSDAGLLAQEAGEAGHGPALVSDAHTLQ